MKFGGIFGLFVGGSVLSLVEIMYYFFMCVPYFLLKKMQRKRKIEDTDKKVAFVLPNSDGPFYPLLDFPVHKKAELTN